MSTRESEMTAVLMRFVGIKNISTIRIIFFAEMELNNCKNLTFMTFSFVF